MPAASTPTSNRRKAPAAKQQLRRRARAVGAGAVTMRIGTAMDQYDIGRSTVYRLIQDRKIIAYKCGKSVLLDAASLRRYIEGLPRVQLNLAAE